MRKRLTKFISVALASAMTLSLIVTGGSSGIGTVNAASGPEKKDSASSVNFKQVLGGAVDYGIVADSITQKSHMETTFATNTYTNLGQNNDVDYIHSTALFLIGSLGAGSSNIRWGYTTATAMYLEAPQNVFGSDYDPEYDPYNDVPYKNYVNGNITFDTGFRTNGAIPVIQAVNPNASSNVNRLINRISSDNPEDNETGWSNFLRDRANDNEYVLNPNGKDHNSPNFEYIYKQVGGENDGKLIIDIDSPEFNDKVVYVNVTADMFKFLQADGSFIIKKDPSSVVVFNIEDSVVGSGSITLKKPVVISDGGRASGGTEICGQDTIFSQAGNTVNSTEVQRLMNETVIWNILADNDIVLDTMGGAMLIPNSQNVKVEGGNSSGWVVTGAQVEVKSEFHFLYSGSSKDLYGEMHFAVNKAFTDKYADQQNVVKNTSVDISQGQYLFKLQEYKNDLFKDADKIGTPLEKEVADKGDVILPVLQFTTDINDTSKRYVPKGGSKEYYFRLYEDPSRTVPGVENSDGYIDIVLKVKADANG